MAHKHLARKPVRRTCQRAAVGSLRALRLFTRKPINSLSIVSNNEFRKTIKWCLGQLIEKFLNISVVMEYLSHVSYLKPVFVFPGGHKANEFYRPCSGVGVSRKNKSLFYIKHNLPELYKIHECKMITKTERDERYSGKFVHCFLDGKTHSYKIHRHLYALMKKIPLFFGYPDGKTGNYQYDVMLKKFVKSENPTDTLNLFYIIKLSFYTQSAKIFMLLKRR